MILDIERERDVLQAKLKGPQKRTANVDVRGGGGAGLDPSQNSSNGPLHSILSVSNKAYEAQVPGILYLHDLVPWTECMVPNPVCRAEANLFISSCSPAFRLT